MAKQQPWRVRPTTASKLPYQSITKISISICNTSKQALNIINSRVVIRLIKGEKKIRIRYKDIQGYKTSHKKDLQQRRQFSRHYPNSTNQKEPLRDQSATTN